MTSLPLRQVVWNRLSFLALLSLLGCSEDDRPPNIGSAPSTTNPATTYPYYEDTREPPSNDLNWARCDLNTSEGTRNNVAECATFEVPARRNVDGTKTLELSIKRYRPVAKPRGQLWLVNGGPGAGSGDFESAIELFTAVGRDLEVYLLDHRGTGKSTALHCPAQEASSSSSSVLIMGNEWTDCTAVLEDSWGDDLSGFNVTEAAADLGESIARTRHGSESVYIYSVSYGTYLVQRYLQLYPAQATGIVLDSICSPGKCELLLNFDRGFDSTARDVMARCAKDAACREQLGADPYARLYAVADSLDSDHCAELGWTRTTLRQVMGLLVMYVGLRDYMPAVVKRVERCSANDVASLKQFEKVLGSFDTEDSSFSQPLSANIALAEMSERPLPTAAEIAENVEALNASIDAGPRMAGAVGSWPIYATDEYYNEFAESAVPLLMLNGDLDPQTPLEVALPTGEHFKGAYQHFIEIPNAAHTTLTQSPIDADYHTCGAELIRQFFNNPEAELDRSCLDFVLPIDFSGEAEVSDALFGTASPFADVALTLTQRLDTTRLSSLKPRFQGSLSFAPWTRR